MEGTEIKVKEKGNKKEFDGRGGSFFRSQESQDPRRQRNGSMLKKTSRSLALTVPTSRANKQPQS